jgi:hypothetical protein
LIVDSYIPAVEHEHESNGVNSYLSSVTAAMGSGPERHEFAIPEINTAPLNLDNSSTARSNLSKFNTDQEGVGNHLNVNPQNAEYIPPSVLGGSNSGGPGRKRKRASLEIFLIFPIFNTPWSFID